MVLFEIREPVWKNRSVGLAEYKITDDCLVRILYEDKSGVRLWPDDYWVEKDKALAGEVMVARDGTRLRMVPIKDLNLLYPKEKSAEKEIPEEKDSFPQTLFDMPQHSNERRRTWKR